MRKSPDILIPAYDDAIGITSAFNLNLLSRINSEIGADFDLSKFRHQAIWNDVRSRIEMHLRSTIAQSVTIAGRQFHFAKDETILTEISRKFPKGHLNHMATKQGWKTHHIWQDPKAWFQLIYFTSSDENAGR